MSAKNKDIELRKRLDNAIEAENMEEIENILESVPDIEAEIDINEFTKSIKLKCDKEVNTMKGRLSMRIAVAVAAVVGITCVSVGAATILKQFSFKMDGGYVSVVSNSDISKEEAEKLAKDSVNGENVAVSDSEVNVAETEKFKSISEAENAYNMSVVMPENMPDLELKNVEGMQTYITEKSGVSTIWITYGDTDKKAFGIVVTKNDFSVDEDITSISSGDFESKGNSFVSEKGYVFDRINDIDEETGRTADIFVTNKGSYEYSMNFTGFNKAEMERIVNSVDLSKY